MNIGVTEEVDEQYMTLAECASYLHLGEKTVLKLVQDGKLPGTVDGRQWQFRTKEIDDWLQQQLGVDEEELHDIPDGMRVPLEDLMPEEAIIDDLRSENALAVVEELAARAYSHRWLADKSWFVGALVEREAVASTAMEGGVAFLHTRAREASRVTRPFIIFGRSYSGIDFGAPDGKPTFLFFLLGLKYDKLHLPVLGRLARIMRSPATVAKLRAAPLPSKIRALLLKEDANARQSKKAVIKEVPKPKLDRQARLRAIMRVDAQRKHRARQAEEADKKASNKKKAADKKAAGKKAASKKAASKKAASKPAAKKAASKKAGGKSRSAD
ncbi:PTS sugar transporter subunit IIA [Haliangium sp.]|uniref:PTS sugar transporter subunit IIA n=1 Tax=Haliangium sp. TaxID=2663208 RepID=UPI003D0EC955